MVFHKTAKKVVTAEMTQTTCHECDRPINKFPIGSQAMAKKSDGPLPIFVEILGEKIPPIIPPTAHAVPRIAKIKTVVLRSSWAKRI